jgi:GxxExxY protein
VSRPFDPNQIRGPIPLDAELEALARDVIDAVHTVHRALRPGYPERVYQRALAIELRDRGIAHEVEAPVQVTYRGEVVGEGSIDILVEQRLVLELKVAESIAPVHVAQVLGYLQAKQLRLGFVINFHTANIRDGIKRVIL